MYQTRKKSDKSTDPQAEMFLLAGIFDSGSLSMGQNADGKGCEWAGMTKPIAVKGSDASQVCKGG